MHQPQRQTAEQGAARRVEQIDDPAIVLPAIEPDQNLAARLGRARQSANSGIRIGQMMDDADTERNIKRVLLGDLVDALLPYLDLAERLEVPLCATEGTIVHVNSDPAERPVGHRPIGVSADAAAAVEEPNTLPERFILRGPAQELLLVNRQEVRVTVPGIAEAVRRSLSYIWRKRSLVRHRKIPFAHRAGGVDDETFMVPKPRRPETFVRSIELDGRGAAWAAPEPDICVACMEAEKYR